MPSCFYFCFVVINFDSFGIARLWFCRRGVFCWSPITKYALLLYEITWKTFSYGVGDNFLGHDYMRFRCMRSTVRKTMMNIIDVVGFLSIEKNNLHSCCFKLVYRKVLLASIQASEMGQHECHVHRLSNSNFLYSLLPKNCRCLFYTFVQILYFPSDAQLWVWALYVCV